MTKEELIEAISNVCCSKREAADCLQAVLDTITKALTKGEDVRITGFGTFSVSKRKARKGKNPRTGEVIQIPAMKVPKFKAGKALKDAVR
jgi:DNA-binding protein HU-beta